MHAFLKTNKPGNMVLVTLIYNFHFLYQAMGVDIKPGVGKMKMNFTKTANLSKKKLQCAGLFFHSFGFAVNKKW